jgi:hypothetical protein
VAEAERQLSGELRAKVDYGGPADVDQRGPEARVGRVDSGRYHPSTALQA